MNTERIRQRADDIRRAIANLHLLCDGQNVAEVLGDPLRRAAYERFIEIISEASRHIPESMKAEHPTIPWRNVANIGNFLRHGYWGLDDKLLSNIYEHDLAPLDDAIRLILSKFGGSLPD